ACIDPYEAPGHGRVPATGLTARAAADACATRGLRLCTPAEWRQACAGTEKALAEAGACNLASAPPGAGSGAPGGATPGAVIVAGGTFEKCVSAIEAHDMAGNVAEWVADGTALGASALDGGDGRCDGPARKADPDATFMDVGYRCCGDR
ncbi:MAG TPA: SUMF1/EgtB/PvdO family nonheme iron enzyme, partial [Kofleriaceae bacterium]|nr:SUMF1/EgtB/PvdO family nonheme iron enzyme [Kofleriaceae bacterium]